MWQVIDSTGHVLYSTASGGIGGTVNNPYVPYASSANTLSDTATTKTQIEYLSAATGTTGTASTNVVFSASPTFTGNVTLNSNVTYTPTVNSSLTGANQRIPSHTTANIVFTNASLTSIGSANNGGVSGGHTLCITNETGGNLTIVNNYGSAAAGEAIFTGLNGDQILPNHASIWLQYDATASAWSSIGGGLIPIATGISGLASGAATWLATPSSANLASLLTDETGTGSAVFATSPTLSNPIVGTQSANNNSTKAASTAYVDATISYGLYKNLVQGLLDVPASTGASTYLLLGAGGSTLITSGGNTTQQPPMYYIDSSDFPSINGAAAKMRIRGFINTNGTAPTGNFYLALFPITAVGGGASVNTYTLGTEVAGSATNTSSAPAANTTVALTGSDFSLPSNGLYVVCLVKTGTTAANSLTGIGGFLQYRHN